MLYIPANTLTGDSYVFQATVTGGSSASTELEVVIEVDHRPTTSVITGGNRTVSTTVDTRLTSELSIIAEQESQYVWEV
jgi:hypothetical protein